MAIELGVGYVSVLPSAKGFSKALDKEIGGVGKMAGTNFAGDFATQLEHETKSGGKIGRAFASVAKVGAKAIGGLGVLGAAAGGFGLAVAAQAEQAELAFTTLLGSAEKAQAFMKDLSKFAAKTPFEMPQLRDAASRFLAVGVEASRVIPIMTTLGDATSLMGTGAEGIDRATTALTQMSQKGKVSAEEMMQLTEAGIPAWDALAAVLGTDVAGAMDQVSQGVVTAESVFTALETGAGEALGRLKGGMEAQATTFNGLWSTLKDTVGQGLGEAMRPVLDILKNQMPNITKIASVAIAGFGKALQVSLTWLIDTGPKVLEIAQGIFSSVVDFGRPAVEWIVDNWPTFRDVIVGAFDRIREALTWYVTEYIPVIIGGVRSVVEWVVANWPTFRDTVLGVFNAVRDWVVANWPTVRDTVLEVFNTVKVWIEENWPSIRDAVLGAFQAISAFVAEHWPGFRDAVVGVFTEIVAFVQENWPKLRDTIVPLLENIALVVGGILAGIYLLWRTFGDDLLKYVTKAFEHIWTFIQGALDIVKGIFDVFIAIFTLDWDRAWEGITSIVEGAVGVILSVVQVFVDNVKLVWQSLDFIRTWLNDNVIIPIQTAWSTFLGGLGTAVAPAISVISTAWSALANFVEWTKINVINPLTTAFGTFWTALETGFDLAVAAVKLVWDGLKEVVKAPVNFVIDPVYAAIRSVWNAIPGIGDLPEISKFAAGGTVPGAGSRDTVPALLTPGEFVVTKKAAQVWGTDVLSQLNNPHGTIDPAVFGYAAGGYVRSPSEALAWAQAQAGKPYEFPMVGPNSYDCSGFLSAVLNYIMGRNPHSRLFSSGTVGAGTAGLAVGAGTPDVGFTMGVDRPRGRPVGHVAATLMGTNIEATPPRVRTGAGARGWNNALFGEAFHLPGYGGLTNDDRSLVQQAFGLLGIDFPDMGEWGKHIFGTLKALLGDIVDTIIKKIPGVGQLISAGQAIGDIVGDALFGGTGTDPGLIAGMEEWQAEHPGETLWGNITGARNGALVRGGHGGALIHAGDGPEDELVLPLPDGVDGFGGERNGVRIDHAEFHEEADVDAVFRAARMYMAAT